jgi:hypothetical protein
LGQQWWWWWEEGTVATIARVTSLSCDTRVACILVYSEMFFNTTFEIET